MRDRLDEELAVQSIRTMVEQERLARRQADWEPWKVVAVTFIAGGAVGGVAVQLLNYLAAGTGNG